MKNFTIEPEVSGELGDKTIIDNSVSPAEVKKLHFIFSGWLGDDIIECFPIFLISQRLKEYLEHSSFTGFSIEICEIDISEDFFLLQPNIIIPKFYWLKIKGGSKDSFFINGNKLLTIKEDVLIKLQEAFNIKNAVISPYKQ